MLTNPFFGVRAALKEVIATPLLNLLASFDKELPRTTLKNIFQTDAMNETLDKAKSKMESEELKAPFNALQEFVKNGLDDGIPEMMEKLTGVLEGFKVFEAPGSLFKFPGDLLKSVDPLEILKAIGEKIPPPLNSAFNKALESQLKSKAAPTLTVAGSGFGSLTSPQEKDGAQADSGDSNDLGGDSRGGNCSRDDNGDDDGVVIVRGTGSGNDSCDDGSRDQRAATLEEDRQAEELAAGTSDTFGAPPGMLPASSLQGQHDSSECGEQMQQGVSPHADASTVPVTVEAQENKELKGGEPEGNEEVMPMNSTAGDAEAAAAAEGRGAGEGGGESEAAAAHQAEAAVSSTDDATQTKVPGNELGLNAGDGDSAERGDPGVDGKPREDLEVQEGGDGDRDRDVMKEREGEEECRHTAGHGEVENENVEKVT